MRGRERKGKKKRKKKKKKRNRRRRKERFTDFICDNVISFIFAIHYRKSTIQTPLAKLSSYFESMIRLFRALGSLVNFSVQREKRRLEKRLEDVKYAIK